MKKPANLVIIALLSLSALIPQKVFAEKNREVYLILQNHLLKACSGENFGFNAKHNGFAALFPGYDSVTHQPVYFTVCSGFDFQTAQERSENGLWVDYNNISPQQKTDYDKLDRPDPNNANQLTKRREKFYT